MSDFDGNFMEPTSYWAPPSSPSPRTILAMLNQPDNDQNPITEMFPQTNHHTEQRSGLGERLAARRGFNPPTLNTQNMNNSPFAAFFRNSSVPSPILAISPGFSPSAMLQSPKIMCSNSSEITPSSPATNNKPPEMVEYSCEGHATKMTFNNDLPHVESIDAPPLAASFESEAVEETNIISMEEESESESESDDESEEEDEDENKDEDKGFVDELPVEPSSPKRRKFEVLPNMIGATRTSKQQRIIIQMECEENNPDDGYRWRKYGQKVVKGNPNPRSYYKCTTIGCKVKKHIERGADNAEIVVVTYDGIHNHAAPTSRGSNSGPRNRSGSSSSSSSLSQNDTGRTGWLDKPAPPPSFTTSLEDKKRSFPSSLGPHIDMTKLYMTGLSKLPSLPVNQNSGFVCRTDEPKVDVIVPDGTEVYNGIMNQLFLNYGVQL